MDVEAVASALSVNVWHAAWLLKQEAGQGFEAHIHRCRIRAASRLLLDTSLSIKAISADVGYGSSSQFGRHFKRLMGTTPHNYRTRAA